MFISGQRCAKPMAQLQRLNAKVTNERHVIKPLHKSFSLHFGQILLDFSLTVEAAPHECVIRTSQP